jgi:hypothetical protein
MTLVPLIFIQIHFKLHSPLGFPFNLIIFLKLLFIFIILYILFFVRTLPIIFSFPLLLYNHAFFQLSYKFKCIFFYLSVNIYLFLLYTCCDSKFWGSLTGRQTYSLSSKGCSAIKKKLINELHLKLIFESLYFDH